MKNSIVIFSGVLLILSAIIINNFMSASKPLFDIEMIKFFTGICFGLGVGILIIAIFGKKRKKQTHKTLQ
ncbi:hypothetical protein MM213_15305 [Belliella sp. R4-6]|uniref:DUF1049 domain-containing protein n=1 Tax=Belliella alkalica TaxID=1730871 RepID=A0ABS9VEJ9_9BACT|nr:hypothetical protein [Belliella alkalica]MCH7414866.1 hypothetical protein [Belliella alkalica]